MKGRPAWTPRFQARWPRCSAQPSEETARHFLGHKGYTDRSFETLQMHLGGFDEEELRRILVRAGAIRIFREDGSEWWRLLSRMDEYISKKNAS